MRVGRARRVWRYLSCYYVIRLSDLVFAIYQAECGAPRYLEGLVERIDADGDMQRREFLLLQTVEVIA